VLESRFGNRRRARLEARGTALSPVFREGYCSLQTTRIGRRADGPIWPRPPALPILRQALLCAAGGAMRAIVGRLVQLDNTELTQALPTVAEE
jgi:hypothetical protein